MSIQSELQTLIQNKADIKTAIETKLSSSISDDMSTWDDEIMSIPSGGGGGSVPDPNLPVKFYDYDGTLLYSYSVEEANALTELPTLPSHDGLTGQGWNYTLAQMKTCIAGVGACDVGATYTTDDGKTRLHITLRDKQYTNVQIKFSQTKANGVTIDWGDGSSTETVSGTGAKTITHQYTPSLYPSSYTISFKVTSGTMSFSTYIMGYSADSTTVPRMAWNSIIDSVNIGNNLTSIGNYAFYYCNSLYSITIPSSVTSIGSYAFQYCISLYSITIPSSVTSIGNNTFQGCSSLYSIIIPPGVTSIGISAFGGCYSLYSIIIPPGVTSIVSSVFNNSLLRSIILPSSVTSIGNYVFQYCSLLYSITLPSSVTSVGDGIFSGCSSLQSIIIPSSITNIKTGMFTKCSLLLSMIIPSSVTSIGSKAFQNCYGIKTFDFSSHTSVPSLDNIDAFQNTPTTKKIVVPDALYDDWIAATNWNSSTNTIKESIIKKSDFDNL